MARTRLFPNAVLEAKRLMAQTISPGETCVDATCGNGHDTLFLARLVGSLGRVYAFDIQETAIANTEQRLETEGVLQQVRLIHAGHQDLARYISTKVAGVMFNLGYLPGTSKEVITTAKHTLAALNQACSLLDCWGLITVALYTGHAGGEQEARQVMDWARALPQYHWDVVTLTFPNRDNNPPYLLAVQKKG